MQVVCERSNTGNDVRCDFCGQGFVVHWAHVVPARRTEARIRVVHALRRQHRDAGGSQHAHAQARFMVSSAGQDPSSALPAEMVVAA